MNLILIIICFRLRVQLKMAADDFKNVFTRQISAANVTTAKAEEKLLEDDSDMFFINYHQFGPQGSTV